jgi:hypothetical protein
MKIHLQPFLVGLLIFAVSCAGSGPSSQNQPAAEYITETEQLLGFQQEISADYLRPHLTAFAHDSMKGRETGTPSEKKAAEYLADEYETLGLKPVGDNGSYFQNFELNATKSDSIVFELYAKDGTAKERISRSVASKSKTADFAQLFGGTDTLSGKVVFAGFGVSDQERGVAHLGGVDLKNKWVMVFQNTPNVVDGDTLIDPKIDARKRFQMIMRQGAAGILIVPAKEPREFEVIAQKMQGSFGETGRMSLAYRESGESSGFSGGYNVVKPGLVVKLLGLKSVEELTDYRQKLIGRITDFQPKELHYQLTQIPYSSKEVIPSQNVLALHEGADPELKEKVVVLTSHYDHVGVGEPDSTGDRIYNGADDDGSGTVGLLNIAKAFAKAEKKGIKPKRSILFLNVSGEEKGLLGSRYYSDHPVFPMEKTVANLNTDMIGRIDSTHKSEGIEKYAYIIGAELISSDLDSLIKTANKQSGEITLNKRYNDLNDPQQFYRRSDHWHFGRKKVPFAFFFTGIHEDYHRPSDEVHKIRFDKMASILRTMYATTVMIANAENHPVVDNQEFIEITKSDN